MAKRPSSLSAPPLKRPHLEPSFSILNVASREAAAAADADPPLGILLRTLKDVPSESPKTGDVVAYWMRMEDMRSESNLLSNPLSSQILSLVCDNRALAQASARAQEDHVPLIVFFVLSPQDYAAHDRSARRIDFTLRNLTVLKVCSCFLQAQSIFGISTV